MKKADAHVLLLFIGKYNRELCNGFALKNGYLEDPSFNVSRVTMACTVERRYHQGYVPGINVFVDDKLVSSMTPDGALKYIAAGWGTCR